MDLLSVGNQITKNFQAINVNLQEELNQIKQSYANQTNQLDNLVGTHDQLRTDYESLRLINEEQELMVLGLQEKANENEQQNQRLNMQYTSVKASYDALLSEHKDYANQINQLKATSADVLGSVPAENEDVSSELQSVNESLSYQLNVAQERNMELEGQVENYAKALQDNAVAWENKYQNLQSQFEIVQYKLEELESEKSNTLERLHLLDGEYGKSISDWGLKYDQLRSDYDHVSHRTGELESLNNELSAQIQNKDQHFQEAISEIGKINTIRSPMN